MFKILKLLITVFLIVSIYPPLAHAKEDTILKEHLQDELIEYEEFLISLPVAFKMYQTKSIILVDIRSKESYEKGHVPESINIPLPSLPQTILENPGVLPKNKAIYVICCAEDRNAMFALLPLRMAGYKAYAVTGGGVDAWIYFKLPIEQGKVPLLESYYQTKLNSLESESLVLINPSYHMMRAGRSYSIKLNGLEKAIAIDKSIFVVEIVKVEQKTASTFKYYNQQINLHDLPFAPWIKDFDKNQAIFLVGENDKELVLAVVTLRMLGYDAIFAFKE